VEHNGNKKVLLSILVILIVIFGGYFLYDKILSNKKNTETTKIIIENNSVAHDDLNYILNILGIPYYNNASNACLTNELSNNNYSLNAKNIISRYIDSNTNVSLEIPEDENYAREICGIGSVDCYIIDKEDAEMLFETYNFAGEIDDYFQSSSKLDDDYIFWYAHTLGMCDTEISHKLVAEYTSEYFDASMEPDVRITDKQMVTEYTFDDDGTRIVSNTFDRKVIYDFKADKYNAYYYLDKVEVK